MASDHTNCSQSVEQRLSAVANATVMLTKKGGQGVLVYGNMILTAAHCINYSCDGSMVLGDHFIEDFQSGERELKVSPWAVEPMADIAVLGSLDNQTFDDEAEAFEQFCEETEPVPLCRDEHELFKRFEVFIRTHHHTWVRGTAIQVQPGIRSLGVEADEPITGGTSGGPIVNSNGELVGIVSNFSDVDGTDMLSTGGSPRPHLALPVWVCREVEEGGDR